MYFRRFPKILYEFQVGDVRKVITTTDILINLRFLKVALNKITLYNEYDIGEGETPEIISEKLYGRPDYHWVLMILNERYDYIDDFPLTYLELDKRIMQLYGEEDDAVHHYTKTIGDKVFTVDSTDPDAYPVSNREYENSLNESKRRIKVLSPQIISIVLNDLNRLLGNT